MEDALYLFNESLMMKKYPHQNFRRQSTAYLTGTTIFAVKI